MPPAYLQHLRDGVTLVTPTRRLATLVAARYGVEMTADGQQTWEAPPVMPLGAWLGDIHARLSELPNGADVGMLLSADQELAIWEQAVDQQGAATGVPVDTLARLAADAWATIRFWQLPPLHHDIYGSRAEVRSYTRWCERFERRCRELDAIDQASFVVQLTDAGRDRLASMPPFRLFGFAPPPPLLAGFATRCPDGGVYALAPAGRGAASVTTRSFATRDAELGAAMQWAVAGKANDPIATVFVALAGKRRIDPVTRSRLHRGFRSACSAAADVIMPAPDCPDTRILADVPVIETALILLDQRRERPWQDISRLLLSPYLGGAQQERAARARLDREHRRNGDIETTWQAVRETASRAGLDCPELFVRIDRIAQASRGSPRRARLHNWMAYAERVLLAAGWPGEQALRVDEQTALLDWSRVMDGVAALDAVTPPCSWSAAFGKWRSLLRRRLPSPQPALDAVNIVTPAEAAFIQPDRLWVAGLNDNAWPEPADNNPLLPLALLRDHGVPGSEPGRDLVRAETLLAQLAQHEEHIVFSYAKSEEDTPRRPFAGLCDPLETRGSAPGWVSATREMEYVDDFAATPMVSGGLVSGGVSLFTELAACPFRAVALYRLDAVAPEDPTPGLNALQRGNLVHAVMASFWQSMRSSARLTDASPAAIESSLERAASVAIAPAKRRYLLPDAYWDLEHRRLVALGHEWLRLERRRGPFEVIACEQAARASVGNFTLNTRIDRIDRLGDGSLLIVDYKTGLVTARDWEPPRPDQPQLPIYATATETDGVAGIAYGQIRPGKMRIVDFPTKRTGPGGADDTARDAWAVRCREWTNALSELAGELETGFAVAEPKRGAATCRYCELRALCRIDEATAGRRALESAGDD